MVGPPSNTDSLYFTAGPDMDSLFGVIAPGTGMSQIGNGAHRPRKR